MTRLICVLLTLLFSLIGPATRANGEICNFALAASDTTRVGRWMSEAEHIGMMNTGRVVESRLNGVTSVSSPSNVKSQIVIMRDCRILIE